MPGLPTSLGILMKVPCRNRTVYKEGPEFWDLGLQGQAPLSTRSRQLGLPWAGTNRTSPVLGLGRLGPACVPTPSPSLSFLIEPIPFTHTPHPPSLSVLESELRASGDVKQVPHC